MSSMFFSRSIATALVLLLSAIGFVRPAAAQTAYCWIDAKTGHPVPQSDIGPFGSHLDDHNHASITGPISGTFATFVRGPNGSWSNASTGTPVPSSDLGPFGSHQDDPNHASISGPISGTFATFVRVPCPATETASSTGLYIGGELVKNWGHVRSTERLAATDVITNQFSDRADPFGGGVIIGYKFAPWANNIVVSPFASFDFIRAPVDHTFAGGSFLGTTANFIGTAGLKIGPQLDMGQGLGLWLYGIAGVSVLDETLNVNFIPVASSRNADVAGATVGLGGAIQPAFLQGFGRPVSLFLEYQHTWWQDANFNTPAASPAFNYTFRRDEDVVKFGFTVSLDSTPSAPVYSSMVFKASPK